MILVFLSFLQGSSDVERQASARVSASHVHKQAFLPSSWAMAGLSAGGIDPPCTGIDPPAPPCENDGIVPRPPPCENDGGESPSDEEESWGNEATRTPSDEEESWKNERTTPSDEEESWKNEHEVVGHTGSG